MQLFTKVDVDPYSANVSALSPSSKPLQVDETFRGQSPKHHFLLQKLIPNETNAQEEIHGKRTAIVNDRGRADTSF